MKIRILFWLKNGRYTKKKKKKVSDVTHDWIQDITLYVSESLREI